MNNQLSMFHGQLTRSRIFLSTHRRGGLERAKIAERCGIESKLSWQHAYRFVNEQDTCPCTLADLQHTTNLPSRWCIEWWVLRYIRKRRWELRWMGEGWLWCSFIICTPSVPILCFEVPNAVQSLTVFKILLFYSISWGGNRPMHVSRKCLMRYQVMVTIIIIKILLLLSLY